MAEEKEEKGKKSAPEISKDPVVTSIEIGVIGLFALGVADAIRRLIESFIARAELGIIGHLREVFFDILPLLKIFSFLISFVFFVGVLHLTRKINMIRAEEHAELYPPKGISAGMIDSRPEQLLNEKWERVLKLVESDASSDWKLAILEADIMLEEILDKMGYSGESMGEKLKSIEKSDFETLDYAWEAHKIRNSIAHEGGDFLLNQREAKRVIELYKRVFEEFYYI